MGLDAYVEALERARRGDTRDYRFAGRQCVRRVLGRHHATALLGYLAARPRPKVHSATLAVCVLDTSAIRSATAGLFVTPAMNAAKAASQKRGVVEGSELSRMFAWMRPNDLIWNYVVNNYLLGNDPPAHEILFWNNDTTRLPAQLHADFLDLFATNRFANPGKLRVRENGHRSAPDRHRLVRRRRPYRSHHDVAGRLSDGALCTAARGARSCCRTAGTSRA